MATSTAASTPVASWTDVALAAIIAIVTLSTDGWEWPDSLDAVVAAPEHHSVPLGDDPIHAIVVELKASPIHDPHESA